MNKYANGLWPTSWGIFCILLPFRTLFQEAAIAHDIAYCLGGSQYDKDVADYAFYIGCLDKSTNLLQKSFSWLYYYWVKSQWYRFFNYH